MGQIPTDDIPYEETVGITQQPVIPEKVEISLDMQDFIKPANKEQ
ncbi:hypothetical protein AB07_1672 [Citrobacter freundii]|nr:hypothetical protein AB07_1672 [Citrobacter freundii]